MRNSNILGNLPIGRLTGKVQSERRSDSRAITFFRPVVIEVGSFTGLCLMKNLSPTGMMGVVYTRINPDQEIAIHFDEKLKVKGTIVWSEPERIGVSFNEAVDISRIAGLSNQPRHGTASSRSPRVDIDVPCIVQKGDREFAAKALNISQRGMKISETVLREHDEVSILLHGMESHKAIVRWAKDGMAGLTFLTPIGFGELAVWVALANSPSK